jgi:hypothetical protein
MRVPSPSISDNHTTMSSETKDLHDGGGDMKDLVDGVQDQVTISPTETEMAILANDAHRYVSRAPRFISILVVIKTDPHRGLRMRHVQLIAISGGESPVHSS